MRFNFHSAMHEEMCGAILGANGEDYFDVRLSLSRLRVRSRAQSTHRALLRRTYYWGVSAPLPRAA